MHCKNYRAYTMAEAMAAVKADLGADAIVLHTRSLTQGGFLGIGRKTVIEITAARNDEAARHEARTVPSPQPTLRGAAASRAYAAPSRGAGLGKAGLESAGLASVGESARTDPNASRDATQFDRDRTRLLAQAMAVKLDREREQAPRTSAAAVASANAAATTVALQREETRRERPVPSGVAPSTPTPEFPREAARETPRETPRESKPAASAGAAPSAVSTSAAAPSGGVAQRFVLMPANDAARIAERQALLHRVTAPARPAPVESVAAPRSPAMPAPSPVAASVASPAAAPAVPPITSPNVVRETAVDRTSDLADINRLVDEVLRRPIARNGNRPERLEALYTNLISQEIGNELADAIITDLHASLTPEELASDHAVRSAAMQRIASLLPIGGGLEPAIGTAAWRRDGRALTVAFVGPTGVGKTTTVAKIAASLKLRHGARVGLITCDTYRIAAVDQLRTYAEIIGLPLEVALSPGQMRQARQRLNDLDVVLIDTAGRSQNDADRIGELAAMVKAAEPHETHLVLSSVASEKVLLREAQAFSTVGVNRVVLTKLDEAAGLGAVLRVVRQIGRGVSYITTGQEVPQHLESARPSRLAELVLGGAPSA